MSVCGDHPAYGPLTPRQIAAIEGVILAVDSRGLRVRLCEPLKVDSVRARMLYLAENLRVGNVHLHLGATESRLAESNAAKNLSLLAELLAAHLEAQT